MLKIWKGPELEGFDKNIITLFIASDTVIDETIVINYIISNHIYRVYLGAGRTSFPGFSNAEMFIQYCIDNDIKVVIEVNALNTLSQAEIDIISKDVVVPIYTFRIPNSNNIIKEDSLFKYDDYNQVIVLENSKAAYTNLDTLQGMTFEADTILLDQ